MKKSHTLTSIICAAHCTALISCEPSGMGGEGGAKREKIIEIFDLDGDGKLNEEERATARKARERMQQEGGAPQQMGKAAGTRLTAEQRERVRERFDKDGDGTLNEEERAAAKRALMKRRQAQEK